MMSFKHLTDEQLRALYDVYYDKKNFFGRDCVWEAVNAKYPKLNISQRAVMNYLWGQQAHNSFVKPQKRTSVIQSMR